MCPCSFSTRLSAIPNFRRRHGSTFAGSSTNIFSFLKRPAASPATGIASRRWGGFPWRGKRSWQAVLDTTTNKPAPMSAFDAFFHLALIVTLRGTPTVVDYYTGLLAEMKTRVAEGISAVPNEEYRLLWDNLPIWYRTRWLSEKFAAQQRLSGGGTPIPRPGAGRCPISRKTISWPPWPRAIRVSTSTSAPTAWPKMVLEMIDKYDVDGLVMHSNRSLQTLLHRPVRHRPHRPGKTRPAHPDHRGQHDRCPQLFGKSGRDPDRCVHGSFEGLIPFKG